MPAADPKPPDGLVSLLVVEDDDIDAEAILRGLRRCRMDNPVVRVKDGVKALATMRGEGDAELRRPFLVLLDLNLPKLSGIEFLQQMRNDESLRSTVVLVLTTSDSPEERAAAYEAKVAGYVLKSRAGRDFIDLVSMLDHYLKVVRFPNPTTGA